MTTPERVFLWVTVAGVAAALIAAAPIVWQWAQATVLRRWSLREKLNAISTDMQLSYYDQLFGVGAFVHTVLLNTAAVPVKATSTIWVTSDAYIQALSDGGGTVILYSITTRTRWFRPVLFRGHTISTDGDTIEVKLGRTRFSALAWQPDGVQGHAGANMAYYDESYWYGNPGNYRHYVYSANLAGHPYEDWLEHLLEIHEEYPRGIALGRFSDGGPNRSIDDYLSRPRVQQARRAMKVNTLTVSKMPPEVCPFKGFGAPEEVVRLLYRPSWLRRIRDKWR